MSTTRYWKEIKIMYINKFVVYSIFNSILLVPGRGGERMDKEKVVYVCSILNSVFLVPGRGYRQENSDIRIQYNKIQQ